MVVRSPRGGWALFTQVAVAFIVTVCLCIWQVGRGLEKRELTRVHQARLNEPPLYVHNWRQADYDYRVIEMSGKFDQRRAFVVDGKFHDGAPGVWVIGVFDTSDGRFLINRGWVPLGASVFVAPDFETPSHTQELKGVLWPSGQRLNPSNLNVAEWPVRTHEMRIADMAAVTASFPVEIRLIRGSAGVFEPASLAIDHPASRHWSYAFQWLFIGGLVVLGYWYFVARRIQAGREGDS